MFTDLLYHFKKPSARTLAQKQLEDAERSLLTHESAAEYHMKMTEYYRNNIARLTRRTQPAESQRM